MPPSDPLIPPAGVEDIDHHIGSLLPAGQYSAAPPTPIICPNCGGVVAEGSRFCGQCGRALGLPVRTTTEATVTILFTDIQGFSDLTSSVGDQEALDALKRHNQIVRAQIQNHGGAEIKYQGDGFMVAFPSARRAVLCAIDIQRKIAEQNRENPTRSIVLRMGLNSGDVLRDEQDLFGAAVNLAARIAEKAKGNQILMSELVKELAGPYPGFKVADRGKHVIKGFPGRYKIFEVAWQT
ncbi:MAG: diguanylate cyclase [Dehalococcoidia bacterium]|nr:diguanylate cyclase [Dehalococcoidia bacterium]